MRNISFEDSLYPLKAGSIELDTTKFIVLSKMLLNNLSSCNNDIIFLNSNGNYKRYINSWLNDGNEYLCYFDLVADNEKTIKAFMELLQLIIMNKAVNIILVPIPCIEFYAVKAFKMNISDEVQILLTRADYTSTKIYTNNMSRKHATFEKYCKALMSTQVHSKYRGSIDKDKYSITAEEENLLSKELPLLFTNGNQTFKTKEVLAINVVDNLYKAFQEQVKRYNKPQCVNKLDTLQKLMGEYHNILV